MICTVTFNPSLDLTGSVEALVPNEKSYVFDEVFTPGGNGINAGIIAARMGGDVSLTGFLGGNNGKRVRSLLQGMGPSSRFIRIENETRMNLTIGATRGHEQTRLSFAGPSVSAREWKELVSHLERLRPDKDIVVLGGSLPPGITGHMVRRLIDRLRRRGIYCMVDMPPQHLKEVLSSRPGFIKPNLQEFQALLDTKAATTRGVHRAGQRLLNLVPLVCVSSVEGGALLMNRKELWFGKTPKLKVRTSVGAGDSLVGAMAYLLSQNRACFLGDLLRHGLAAACATLTEPGLTLGEKESIEKYSQEVSVERLL